MQVGDLVEGFCIRTVGLKGVLTKVEYDSFNQGTYYILWSDGTYRKHMRHQFRAELS